MVLFSATAVAQTLTVPAGQKVVLTTQARGAQIYNCTAGASNGEAPRWIFVGPDADLFVGGLGVGKHSAGPTWTYQDGSSVKGTLITSEPSKRAGAIPWLLLSGAGAGPGLLNGVTYITRTATSGGTTTNEVCNAAAVGTVLRKPYEATYTFYAAAQ